MLGRAVRALHGMKVPASARPSTSGSDTRAGKSPPGVDDFTVSDPTIGESTTKATNHCTKELTRRFKEILPDVIRDLTFEGPFRDVPKVNEHLSKCLQYSLMHGKLTRGIGVAVTYKLLALDPAKEEEGLKSAAILGWCAELLQAHFLILDDIMDGSTSRRGQPCWHTREGVGLEAINDSCYLQSAIYSLLGQHFAATDPEAHRLAVDAFLHTTRCTIVGQSLDMLSQVAPGSTTQTVDGLTMKLYSNIVKYKTAHYSFCLPVQLGMGLAGIRDDELYRQASNVLLETGKFFQVQDDFLDCFGDPEVTGKQGTDIQDGKCSWLIVVAMQRASPKQKERLRELYGSKDEEHVAQVKQIYEDLKLPKVFLSYEEEAYNDILSHIGQMSGGTSNRRLNPEVFYYFLNRIYKREK